MALADVIRSTSKGAVLARDTPQRLEEFVERDAVTHRSKTPWTTAKAGVDQWGQLPIYYVERGSGGMVTHKGYISEIVVDPVDGDDVAERFREHVTSTDTRAEYADGDESATTIFLATHGRRVPRPFHQSELRKLSGDGTVAETYSRQPIHVKQRPGDFPNFQRRGSAAGPR